MALKQRKRVPTKQETQGQPTKIENTGEKEENIWQEWQSWQNKWFWNAFRKGLYVKAVYLAFFTSLIIWNAPDRNGGFTKEYLDITDEYQIYRVMLSFTAFAIAYTTFHIDFFHGVAPQKSDVKYFLLRDNIGGQYIYLTVNTIFIQLVHRTLSFAAEALRLIHNTGVLTQKILYCAYETAVFCNTLGVVLTLLFLRFNWFETKWRQTVYDVYVARGHKYFGFKTLFVHVNQIFIGFFDVLIIKDRKLLTKVTPTLDLLILLCIAYALTYQTWVHLNKYASNGYVPYPVLERVMESWKLEVLFITGVSVTVLTCAAVLHFFTVTEFPLVDYNLEYKIRA